MHPALRPKSLRQRPTRRQLLAAAIAAAAAPAGVAAAEADGLVVVDGWVVRRSELRAPAISRR